MCLGIPARVVEITDASNNLGVVDVSGVRRQASLACIVDEQSPVQGLIGKWVLLHVGFAMSVIDETEALLLGTVGRQVGHLRLELVVAHEDHAATLAAERGHAVVLAGDEEAVIHLGAGP